MADEAHRSVNHNIHQHLNQQPISVAERFNEHYLRPKKKTLRKRVRIRPRKWVFMCDLPSPPLIALITIIFPRQGIVGSMRITNSRFVTYLSPPLLGKNEKPVLRKGVKLSCNLIKHVLRVASLKATLKHMCNALVIIKYEEQLFKSTLATSDNHDNCSRGCLGVL
jgi:hypothetical protein